MSELEDRVHFLVHSCVEAGIARDREEEELNREIAVIFERMGFQGVTVEGSHLYGVNPKAEPGRRKGGAFSFSVHFIVASPTDPGDPQE